MYVGGFSYEKNEHSRRSQQRTAFLSRGSSKSPARGVGRMFLIEASSPMILFLAGMSLFLLVIPNSKEILRAYVALPPFAFVKYRWLNFLRLFTHPLAHADFGHLFNNFKHILLLGPGMVSGAEGA